MCDRKGGGEGGFTESVPVDIMDLALLQENIRLVKQQDGTPGMCNIQNLLQLMLQPGGIRSQLSCRDHVQRTLEHLTDSLRSQRLACTRRAMKNRHEAFALALHDVVNGLVRGELVAFDEGADDGFLIGREDKGVEGLLVPADLADLDTKC